MGGGTAEIYQQSLFMGHLSIPLPLARQADHFSILLQLLLVVMPILTYVLRWRVSPVPLAPILQACTAALGTPGPWLQMSTCQATTRIAGPFLAWTLTTRLLGRVVLSSSYVPWSQFYRNWAEPECEIADCYV